jgi:two-component system OmpR family sensor kinase
MTTPEDYPKLLSLAVHEFRTPASVVGGYLRMLRGGAAGPLSDPHLKMVEEAEKSCARIVALVAELSEVGKLDAGLITMARQPLNLFAVVQEVASGMHEAGERGVTLETRGTAEALLVGDGDRLRSAFHAIFKAILREMPDSSNVVAERRVAVADGRSSAVVVIAEAGSVQTSYDAPRSVFDEKRGGLGLLLPLARRVIEAHGGQLWSPRSASETDNRGARGAAIIALPLPECSR